MNRRPPWRPTLFVSLSVVLHAAAVMGYVVFPDTWPWGLGVVIVNHVFLACAGLLPRSTWLGPTLTRLPDSAVQRGEVAITIDDGPDPEVTPQVLAILEQHQARATFFCIGERAQAHPDLCRQIISAGHDIENHGQHHRHHSATFGLHGWRREIEAAQRTLTDITGTTPRFYRAVAGLRNPFLDPVLHRLDMQLASWTRRGFDTRRSDPKRVLAALLDGLAAGDILLLHDGHCARMSDGRPVILAVLPRLLDELAARRLTTVTLRTACNPR